MPSVVQSKFKQREYGESENMKKNDLHVIPRNWFYFFALIFSLFVGKPALAGGTCTILSMPPVFIMPESVAIPRDAPVNSLIGAPVTQFYSFRCTSSDNFSPSKPARAYIQFRTVKPAGWTLTSSGLVMPTNVPGVGVLLTNTTAFSSATGNDFGYATSSEQTVSGSVRLQLIKTGSISGGIVSGVPDMFRFQWVILGFNNSMNFPGDTKVAMSGGTRINVVGCGVSVDSVNKTVVLPQVTMRDFTGVGKTAARTPFDIKLNCQSDIKVGITFSAANASPSFPGTVLPDNSAGRAGGVAVQLVNNINDAIKFDTKNAVGVSGLGVFTIPLQVQYIQTSDVVSPGKLTAAMTFNLSYE